VGCRAPPAGPDFSSTSVRKTESLIVYFEPRKNLLLGIPSMFAFSSALRV
jgi:hypothetical protein